MWTQGISWSLLGEPLGPVAQWGTCLDEARAFIAGVRSPPLRGGRAKVGWPWGKNQRQRTGRFPRRGAVSAPGWRGRAHAEAFHSDRRHAPVKPKHSLTGVRSPPLHRVDDPSQDGLGGKPRDNAKGGFLGGARSPRPCGKALLMPRHFIRRDGWPKARGPNGDMPRSSPSIL
jgi:hypothetical protein